ncbi:MAG: hypothetical protein HY874_11035 [Chloroflexi bacterium]|nr:hypothetical protein [Chloroflexota bacterium]
MAARHSAHLAILSLRVRSNPCESARLAQELSLPRSPRMSRLVRNPVALYSFAFLFVAFPIWLWTRAVRPNPLPTPAVMLAASEALLPPPPANFRVTLLRSGLRPEALAAAGVPPSSIASALQAAQSLTMVPTALASADAAFANARRASDRLERLIQSGKGTPADVAAYQIARAALASATAQRQAVLDQVFDAATTSLSTLQRTALINLRANAAWNLPPEFLVVNRTQEDWVRLRDALANEKIARKLHDQPDASAQAQLANWRSHSAVAAARGGLDTSLAQIRTNWNAAAGD